MHSILKVDFYSRGLHPPNAMHSEGHQDSMGVCLFLALSEHQSTGLIDLVILDDIVMSLDIGHRRMFCRVLVSNFPNKQFIITTHDTTWANQLRGEGLVNRKQMLKFFDWSVDSGPKVPYTLDDRGSLGDFLPAAISRHNDLLNKAKEAANSWNKQDEVATLSQRSIKTKEIIKRALGEQGFINITVHFNDWANLGKEDFKPVVEAFQELCDSVFACDNEGCDAVLKVTFDGPNMNGVRCKCGAVNWNLIKRETQENEDAKSIKSNTA